MMNLIFLPPLLLFAGRVVSSPRRGGHASGRTGPLRRPGRGPRRGCARPGPWRRSAGKNASGRGRARRPGCALPGPGGGGGPDPPAWALCHEKVPCIDPARWAVNGGRRRERRQNCVPCIGSARGAVNVHGSPPQNIRKGEKACRRKIRRAQPLAQGERDGHLIAPARRRRHAGQRLQNTI
jgi:hypothetical protein